MSNMLRQAFCVTGVHDAAEFPPAEEPAGAGVDIASSATIDGEPVQAT